MPRKVATYTLSEIGSAWTTALSMQIGFFALLVIAGQNKHQIKAVESEIAKEVPIAVRPVIDDLPLLKLGGKRVRTKLPDMWRKAAPVQRFEQTSAPSPMAPKTPEAIPSTPLAKPDAAPPPPPDAEVAKKVDQVLTDAAPPPPNAPTVQGEGSPDGVKEGTETDPLKARVLSQYQAKIMGWFNVRFRQPTQIECEVRKKLRTSVVVNVGADRQITGYSVARASGNAEFDAAVKASMDSNVGQQLPPPPPLYPDILNKAVTPVFQGQCDQ